MAKNNNQTTDNGRSILIISKSGHVWMFFRWLISSGLGFWDKDVQEDALRKGEESGQSGQSGRSGQPPSSK